MSISYTHEVPIRFAMGTPFILNTDMIKSDWFGLALKVTINIKISSDSFRTVPYRVNGVEWECIVPDWRLSFSESYSHSKSFPKGHTTHLPC